MLDGTVRLTPASSQSWAISGNLHVWTVAALLAWSTICPFSGVAGLANHSSDLTRVQPLPSMLIPSFPPSTLNRVVTSSPSWHTTSFGCPARRLPKSLGSTQRSPASSHGGSASAAGGCSGPSGLLRRRQPPVTAARAAKEAASSAHGMSPLAALVWLTAGNSAVASCVVLELSLVALAVVELPVVADKVALELWQTLPLCGYSQLPDALAASEV
mmetsp:Transcript_99310/g.281100  ORF Transcript_99310/g.281100 Transcript_99310/m.281100 type:complete len:215 (+) Transcript_99310:1459-2103(+)